ncbi:MAG: class I SAM-dependent methyltransferase [Rhodocyclaceae bacterium]|nr:class I SAM-dependent methyltransferase [Rhodocyclaceae bacterium]
MRKMPHPLLRKLLTGARRKRRSSDPGHFYSPIPDPEEIRRDEARIFGAPPRQLPGIDMREAEQMQLLESFAGYYESMPFRAEKTAGLRYHFDNPAYSYSDAILLHCMIRHVRPRRFIEVGSGYSSCVTLDTSELFFGAEIETTFIEPYPALLESLLKEGDRARIRIVPSRLQDVPLATFEALESNDILFIDSTHVGKTGSDVNHLFFEILPRLASGVHVHVHDIFYPFEYPKEWVYKGRAWNEAYMTRAFLQYNAAFRIALMNTFMQRFHADFFREKMPLCLRNPGGSLWLRRE